MTGIDYLKALAGGFLLLALNLLITTGVITVDALLIEPGHPETYYQAKAPQIGACSGPIGGAVVQFVAAFVLGRRRPARPAVVFAAWLFGAYLLFDAGSGLAFGGLKIVADPRFIASMTAALIASLAGGALARR